MKRVYCIDVAIFMHRSATARKRTRFNDEDTLDENIDEENKADESCENGHFRKHMLCVVFDNVIGGLAVRFNVAKHF